MSSLNVGFECADSLQGGEEEKRKGKKSPGPFYFILFPATYDKAAEWSTFCGVYFYAGAPPPLGVDAAGLMSLAERVFRTRPN